jgi:hypothetical protein
MVFEGLHSNKECVRKVFTTDFSAPSVLCVEKGHLISFSSFPLPEPERARLFYHRVMMARQIDNTLHYPPKLPSKVAKVKAPAKMGRPSGKGIVPRCVMCCRTSPSPRVCQLTWNQ